MTEALFINDTSGSYHWGCYATSTAIKDRLSSDGYVVASYAVEETHNRLGNPPTSIDELETFKSQLRRANPSLWHDLNECDLVVVNGEGTLHRSHAGPRGLLALMWTAKRLDKRVHLINHSLFPSGTREPAAVEVEDYYRACLSDLDRIVVREPYSREAYRGLGIEPILGFDCLPLYAERRRLPDAEPAIVIGGASNWTPQTSERVAQVLLEILPKRQELVFLSGGSKSPPEDIVQFETMRGVLSSLRLVEPGTADEWIARIAHARLVITGRFHHLIAAAATTAPVVMMPGNTPKSDGVCSMLNFRTPISTSSAYLAGALSEAVSGPDATSVGSASRLRELAAANFGW